MQNTNRFILNIIDISKYIWSLFFPNIIFLLAWLDGDEAKMISNVAARNNNGFMEPEWPPGAQRSI